MPFDDDTVLAFLDTTSGGVVMELGELDEPDVTVTTDYPTAQVLFVDQDPAVAMQSFMNGKIKVQGDMMKLMAMQTSLPTNEASETIAQEIKDITEPARPSRPRRDQLIRWRSVRRASASASTVQRSVCSTDSAIAQVSTRLTTPPWAKKVSPLNRAAFGAEVGHERRHVRRIPLVEAAVARGHDVLEPGRGEREACPGGRCDTVADDVVAGELLGGDLAERRDAGLRCPVVRLARIAEQPRRARRVDEVSTSGATGLVFAAPVDRCMAGRREVTLEVHGDDVVPFGFGHVDDGPVAQDPCVVHQDVDVTVGIDRRADQSTCAVPVGDVVVVGDRLATGGTDLRSDLVGWCGVTSRPVVGAPVVVDDHASAERCEQQCMLAAEAAAGAGDDGDPSIQ